MIRNASHLKSSLMICGLNLGALLLPLAAAADTVPARPPAAQALGKEVAAPNSERSGGNQLTGQCPSQTLNGITNQNAHAALTISPSTRWQPYGGDVKFEITRIDNPPTHISVYFAWPAAASGTPPICLPSPRVRLLPTLDSDNAQTYRFAARVPYLDSGSLIDGVDHWQATSTVPLADMYVVGSGTAYQTTLAFVASVGISTPWLTLFVAFLSGVVVWVVLAWWVYRRNIPGGPFLAIISTPNGVASLSQFQILIWTFVIGIGVVYVMMLSGNLIDIPTPTLSLLGITGFALVGAKLQANATPQHARLAPGTPPTLTPADMEVAAKTTRIPQWSDLVLSGNNGVEVDMARLQMLVFTSITAIFTAVTLINTGSIPDLPVGELALVGISNGVYLASKSTGTR
jgi:hypothetical protein